MFRPTSDLTAEPGIKYLEYMGMRILRMMMLMRGMLFFMGGGMLIAGIVLMTLNLDEFLTPMYWILIGGGIFIILVAIVQIIFGVNRWYFKKIQDMRDAGDVQGLKKIVYGYGTRSSLAMYALVDLGEVDPYMLQRYPRSSYSGGKQSVFDD